MPIFEYNCENCNYTFDQLVMKRDSQVNCPFCRGDVKKLMSTFAVGLPQEVAQHVSPASGCTSCHSCNNC
jgi:putative FmdB family regulatory protein